MRNHGGFGEAGRWDELHSLVKAHHAAIEYGEDGSAFWNSMNDQLYEVDHVECTEQASQVISEYHEVLALGCND